VAEWTRLHRRPGHGSQLQPGIRGRQHGVDAPERERAEAEARVRRHLAGRAEAIRPLGAAFRFGVQVDGGKRLRICLAYTDLPARGLQNDLNLIVEDPAGAKHVGNEQLPERLTPFDRGNNVEVVQIDNPAPGNYLIQVSAFNLLGKGQDFALVVTGELGSGLTPA
jgi:hypothetical protein